MLPSGSSLSSTREASRTTGGCWPRNDVSDELPVLWQYSFSNYNEKARWALDHKGIRHRRRSLMPGGPRAMGFARRGTLPVLDIDGERIVDSTAIIARLEARQPERALYPADPDERRRALDLEDFLDENAGHDMRRVGFWEAKRDLGWAVRFMTTDQPKVKASVGRVGLRTAFPFVWSYMSKRYAFGEEAVMQSRETLTTALDRIESERAGGDYLVGESFTVADLTAASLFYPLVWPPEFQYALPERPAWALPESLRDHAALEWIAGIWRRHRGEPATSLRSPARP
jgi:glutathione S-transferase